MMKKRLTALFLAVLLMNIPVLAEEQNSGFAERMQAVQFADMKALPLDHWSSPAVYTVTALGALKGATGGFLPTGTASRSEALAVLMRAAGLENTAMLAQQNVQKNRQQDPAKYNTVDAWADGYIRLAVDYKILSVDDYNKVMGLDYTYNPASRVFIKEGAVTRLEVAEWFVRIFKLSLAEKADLVTDFTDAALIPKDKLLYVETALRQGLIQGYGDTLNLEGTITRQELAQMLYNMRSLLCEKNGITVKTDSVSDILTDTLSATEAAVTNRTTLLLAGGETLLCTRTYPLNGVAVDYNAYNAADTDILTVKSGYAPSGVHNLSVGDKVELYYQADGTLFFILALPEKDTQNGEILDETYIEGTPVTGRLYLIDPDSGLLIIEQADSFVEIPYLSGVQAFWRNTEQDIFTDPNVWLDTPCVVFCARKSSGTLNRAYRIQFLSNPTQTNDE